jgi:cbb3-type cytochrome oxidase subunit 3
MPNPTETMDPATLTLFTIAVAILMCAVGLALLLAGRRLLWLLFSLGVAALVFWLVEGGESPTDTNRLIIAAVAALAALVVFILLNRITKPIAAALSAFFGGLIIATVVLDMYRQPTEFNIERIQDVSLGLIFVLVMGIVAAGLAVRWPNDALINLSAVIGAALVVAGLQINANSALAAIVWLALTLLGVIVQYAQLQRERRKRRADAARLALPNPQTTLL